MTRGKYIVLEGPEGVGKTSQLAELARRMRAAGLAVRTLREPDSQSDLTARAIRQLTQDPQYPMNTRTEVLLYNAARSQSLQAIKNSLEHGVHCLVDRNYLTTLAVQFYGRGDVPDYYTINNIIAFAVGGLEPDLTIILDAPVNVLKSRSGNRRVKERFDDLDTAFLERVRAGYLWEAKQRDYPVVYASQSFDKVTKDIWELTAQALARREQASNQAHPASIERPDSRTSSEESNQQVSTTTADTAENPDYLTLLKAVAKQSLPSYFTPKNLDTKSGKIFKDGMENLLAKRAEFINKLKTANLANEAAAWLTLPTACYFAGKSGSEAVMADSNNTLKSSATKLDSNYSEAGDRAVELIDYWPRNELSLASAFLFKYAKTSHAELAKSVDAWSYDQKAKILRAGAKDSGSAILASAGYVWEVLLDFTAVLAFKQEEGIEVVHQKFTPRHGYAMPPSIEKAGLADYYEACFDASLEFYSKLQAAGYESQAQLATLTGHKVRARIMMSAQTLKRLQKNPSEPPKTLVASLAKSAATAHPLLGEPTTASESPTKPKAKPKRNLKSSKSKKHN